jgi:uncharacterized paraquat-inducible protein A
MTTEKSNNAERIPAGECPNCGVVADTLVNWNFPNPATCDKCDEELTVAGMATYKELEEYA